MSEKLIQAAEDALNLLIEAGADTPSKAGTAHNRIRRALSQLKVATSKGFYEFDNIQETSPVSPKVDQEPCRKTNGVHCKLHDVEHGREDKPATVHYRDGGSRTFQVRKIDMDRDWIFLESSAGKTVAIISAREVHSITRD